MSRAPQVGDCYIALTGLDDASGDATRVLEFAIRAVLEAAAMVLPNGAPLSVRVGMHTGPVTAGVVGLVRKKFTLLGNTVNVASRMESTSEPNTVHITEVRLAEMVRCSLLTL